MGVQTISRCKVKEPSSTGMPKIHIFSYYRLSIDKSWFNIDVMRGKKFGHRFVFTPALVPYFELRPADIELHLVP